MSDRTQATIHPVVPLAVLETLRSQDVPQPDGLDEFHVELSTKRLGMSRTIERQIERYRHLMDGGVRVAPDEVVALFRLAARRPDADLLFADAGRRAGLMAVHRAGRAPGAASGGLRRRLGRRTARRVLRRTFGLNLVGASEGFVVEGGTPFTADVAPDGSACQFLGAAVAAVLRAYTGFEGAVAHDRCHASGADSCRWEAARYGKV
jgi:hypothetical protein